MKNISDDISKSRRRRNDHWNCLKKAHQEFDVNRDFVFTDWLEKKYGVALVLDSDGRITGDYRIVDESKYSFYLLKFS